MAVCGQAVGIVQLLLKHGADPSLLNYWNESPLIQAESPAVVTSLLNRKKTQQQVVSARPISAKSVQITKETQWQKGLAISKFFER